MAERGADSKAAAASDSGRVTRRRFVAGTVATGGERAAGEVLAEL